MCCGDFGAAMALPLLDCMRPSRLNADQQLLAGGKGGLPASRIAGNSRVFRSVSEAVMLMPVSVFELFKIGIGPSSSHTVGPMIAAAIFAEELEPAELDLVTRLRVELFGSLGATGRGHQTDKAILLGLEGVRPATAIISDFPKQLSRIHSDKRVHFSSRRSVALDPETDLIFRGDQQLPPHPNGIRFTAVDGEGRTIRQSTFFSVGGGFVHSEAELLGDAPGRAPTADVPFPFSSAAHLLAHCQTSNLDISDVVMANETAGGLSGDEVSERILKLWEVMQESVRSGFEADGMLPGPLRLRRRAPSLRQQLLAQPTLDHGADPLASLDWIDLYAIAVGEENASGGRIVTAPTNGAAGIIPAVLHYGVEILGEFDEEDIVRFFLTASAIGSLYKDNASLSAADVGCQGEVGVACSMAAAALAERRGGRPEQVQNAAEIAMEHNLGLTCDPIGGLVQIPCIERNAMGAVKAVNAARMALRRDRAQYVSLDQVIETMRETGRDMSAKYKETSTGGLAVNVPEC